MLGAVPAPRKLTVELAMTSIRAALLQAPSGREQHNHPRSLWELRGYDSYQWLWKLERDTSLL